jgi:uncharacterized delta-60 repeat protein
MIGSEVAAGTTIRVTTDGNYDLTDGVYSITARQTETGKMESAASSALSVTIDTVAPIAPSDGVGDLDTTFSGDGIVKTSITGASASEAHAVTVQEDGRVVVAGESWVTLGHNNDFTFVRYNADGTPDTAFGGDGQVTTDFDHSYDEAHAVAVQPDGKIVAAGTIGIARYESNGTLDATFGTDGVTTVIGQFQAIAIQQDGKLLAAG